MLLVVTIQGSIWMNFSLPYLLNEPVFFLGYLVVSAIQMGATIDYAILQLIPGNADLRISVRQGLLQLILQGDISLFLVFR